MSKINRLSSNAYALHLEDGRVFTLSTRTGDDMNSVIWGANAARNWEVMPQYMGDFRVVPFGLNNNLPSELRDIVDGNNLAPGIIER